MMKKRFVLLALAAGALLGIALTMAVFLPSAGTTSATGSDPQATATPATPGGDKINQMRSMMDSMHGQGSFDAMRQQMEENNPGSFDQMLQNCLQGNTNAPNAAPSSDQNGTRSSGMMGGANGGMMNGGGMMGGSGTST